MHVRQDPPSARCGVVIVGTTTTRSTSSPVLLSLLEKGRELGRQYGSGAVNRRAAITWRYAAQPVHRTVPRQRRFMVCGSEVCQNGPRTVKAGTCSARGNGFGRFELPKQIPPLGSWQCVCLFNGLEFFVVDVLVVFWQVNAGVCQWMASADIIIPSAYLWVQG